MGKLRKLRAPDNLHIDFTPSPKQYELWKLLQPECPKCGGVIKQQLVGYDANHNAQYKPFCYQCGNANIPQLILGGGSASGGKMGLLDSSVCTPFGFRKIRDLKVGDIITSATTGGQQRIIQLHPIAEFDFYRVHFIDGTSFDCSEGHLWQLHQSRKKTKKKDENGNRINERVWETRKMYEWVQRKKNGMYKGCDLIIPVCAPVQFTMTNMLGHPKLISPYILGALLGDGCMTESVLKNKSIQLTTMDEEIVDKFRSEGYDMSYSITKPNNKAKNYIIKNQQLIEDLNTIKIAGHNAASKFIPIQYKYATIEERKLLMQGLMDTDGYVDGRGYMSYSTVSENLAEDVAFVIRSLGGIATVKKNQAGYKTKEGVYVQCRDVYDVYIRTKFDPELVNITRKKNRCRYEFNGGNSELGKRITDIEFIGRREGRCITVDEPCGLYVADNFTITHNSYLASVWLVSGCLRFPEIRAIVARKTLKSLKESTWNTIRSVIKRWGLIEDVHYRVNNLAGTLTFWNDSIILMLEMADLPSDPDVTLVMAIPFMGQELMYSPSDKLRYKRILEQANDKVVIWSGSYSSLAYHKRNDFLVNNCSEIIAYSNGLGRGTKSTVDKAKRAGVDALNLYDELDDYFRIENRTKTFLQNFPNISSFMYGREGVIFKGDNQPFPVNFNQIVKIEQNHDSLCFFLTDGLKISASLTLDECFASTPKSDR